MSERKIGEVFIPEGDTRFRQTAGANARKIAGELIDSAIMEEEVIQGVSVRKRPLNIPGFAKLPKEQREGFLPGYHVIVYKAGTKTWLK